MGDVQYDTNPPDYSIRLKEKEMDLESGILGKMFGCPKNAPTNIAGVVAVLSMIAVFIVVIWPGQSATNEPVKLLVPVITLILGYLFGKKQ
ncbi:MAG: hypothetical protein ACLQNE_43920 [Thermoguttaceae bacterium]